jgi:hypothetical protein
MTAAGLSEALFDWLTSTVPLAGGWYPLRLPDGAMKDGVCGTYQRISTRRPMTHSGGTTWAQRRFQLTIYADRYTAALVAARDVVDALNGVRASMDGWDVSATIADEAEDVDPEPRGLFRQRIDVMLGSDAP